MRTKEKLNSSFLDNVSHGLTKFQRFTSRLFGDREILRRSVFISNLKIKKKQSMSIRGISKLKKRSISNRNDNNNDKSVPLLSINNNNSNNNNNSYNYKENNDISIDIHDMDIDDIDIDEMENEMIDNLEIYDYEPEKWPFTSHAPHVFRYLRNEIYSINDKDYIESICPNLIRSHSMRSNEDINEKFSEGRSGYVKTGHTSGSLFH